MSFNYPTIITGVALGLLLTLGGTDNANAGHKSGFGNLVVDSRVFNPKVDEGSITHQMAFLRLSSSG